MELLNDDALRGILIRSCASDHTALRQTCKRFSSILNSFTFRQERANLGYCEVQEALEIPSPLECYKSDYEDEYDSCGNSCMSLSSQDSTFQRNYDELGRIGEYGEHTFSHFKIIVDGKQVKMEKFIVRLLPRKRVPFFEMCDCLEGPLQQLSVVCFNNRGKLRLRCLKEAVPAEDRRPLLYISHFELPAEYRCLSSTVGPLILHSLLSKTPFLRNSWSIAMYIPWYKAQLSKENKKEDHEMETRSRKRWHNSEPNADPSREDKDWDRGRDELTYQDMRMFFRAGFHQVSDPSVVETSTCYYLYATPNDLPKTSILSEQDVLGMEILKKPPKPTPSKKDTEKKELLKLMTPRVQERRALQGLAESPPFQPKLDKMEIMQEMLEEKLDSEEKSKKGIEETRDLFASQIDTMPPTDDARRESLEKLYTEMEGIARIGGFQFPSEMPQPLTVNDIFQPAISHYDSEIEKLTNLTHSVDGCICELENSCFDFVAEREEELKVYDKQVCVALDEWLEEKATSEEEKEQLIIKSTVVHVCAYHMAGQPYIRHLLDKLPTSEKKKMALDYQDEHGSTPLMVAAASGSLSIYEETKRLNMCQFLINHGADKDVQNRRGLTALGVFRESRKSCRDLDLTFGFRDTSSDEQLRNQLETNDCIAMELDNSVLMPASGPSPADEALAVDSEESGEDDESDDFSMEEEDEDDDE